MRRVVARYDEPEDATDAENDLRDDDFEPERPEIENPFFDPSARPPEARGLLWGGIIGGVVGAAILLTMALDMIWFPRLCPIMTAGRLALVTFGFTVGVAVGSFTGGTVGLLRDVPDPEGPRVAVEVSDAEVDDAVARHGGQ